MPFAPGLFDAAVMVRVLHHMQQPQTVLGQVRGVLGRNGVFVLEFANKRNFKAIARWLAGRQAWDPFDRQPVEFVKLNFDFHPAHVRQMLDAVGLAPGRTLTVSHFRVGLIKRLAPTGLLVALDSAFQLTGGLWQLAPSVFIRSQPARAAASGPAGAFWRCPECSSYFLNETGDGLTCQDCRRKWRKINGVYDFKEPAK
jgi:SAM-dependent methyltransferase